MRTLMLLRHAESLPIGGRTTSDHDRPLSADGQDKAAAMGKLMHRLALIPQLVLVSSSLRTIETLRILAAWDAGPRIEVCDKLYLADPLRLLDIVRNLPDNIDRALLIGHNPGLHNFAEALLKEESLHGDSSTIGRLTKEFPPAALVELAISGDWSGIAPQKVKLVHFLLPDEALDAFSAVNQIGSDIKSR